MGPQSTRFSGAVPATSASSKVRQLALSVALSRSSLFYISFVVGQYEDHRGILTAL